MRFSVFPGKQLLALGCPLPFGLFFSFPGQKPDFAMAAFGPLGCGTALPHALGWQPSEQCWSLICILVGPPVLCIQQTSYSLKIILSPTLGQAAFLPHLDLFLHMDKYFGILHVGLFSFHSEEGHRDNRPCVTQRPGGVFPQSVESFRRRVHLP